MRFWRSRSRCRSCWPRSARRCDSRRLRRSRPPCRWPTSAGRQIIGELKQRLETVKALKLPVLITGEPGCGKSLCARFLHQANTPWVAPESFDILDDPANNIVGQAAEGTLFLHEVGDLTGAQQRNLLAQLGKLERYHTRLICSTSRPLARLVAEAAFDSRLYAAISQIQLRVPSLREHPEDIPELAKLILSRLVESKEVPPRTLGTAALNVLRVQDWPGNLTQLESVVRTMALVGLTHEIGISDVNSALAELDAPAVGRALRRCRWTWSCARRATPSSACTSSITSRGKART